MIPSNSIQLMGNFEKGELVKYSNYQYPWRIKAFEKENVAWIAETYGTKYVSGGRVARVLRVPISQLRKTEQTLGKFNE